MLPASNNCIIRTIVFNQNKRQKNICYITRLSLVRAADIYEKTGCQLLLLLLLRKGQVQRDPVKKNPNINK